MKKNNMKLKKVLSLFSGCGGMDLGFEGGFNVFREAVNPNIHPEWIYSENNGVVTLKPTSFVTVFANDIDENAKKAWENYFSQIRNVSGVFHLGSIVDYVKMEKAGHRIFPKDIDVVTGGFPCQDFSVSGKRLGFNSHKSHTGKLRSGEPTVESRGKLYMWMREVIGIVQPKIFVAENVRGLITLKDVKKIVENDFRSVAGGYLVLEGKVLNAIEYGVPQTRERVIFIGFKKSELRNKVEEKLVNHVQTPEYSPFPVSTHSARTVTNNRLLSVPTVRYAFKDLVEPQCSDDESQRHYSKAKYMGNHCQGQIEVNIDQPGPTIRSEHHGNIEYRRLSKSNGGKIYNELDVGLPERRLTVRECARIQTFPDQYEFVIKKPGSNKYFVSASAAYKLVGNAVPPLLGYHIAMRLESLWDKWFKV